MRLSVPWPRSKREESQRVDVTLADRILHPGIRCVRFDDIPDGTDVGRKFDAAGNSLPGRYADFYLDSVVPDPNTPNVLIQGSGVYVRQFADAASSPNVISVNPTGDPGLQPFFLISLLFHAPKSWFRLRARPLASTTHMPSGATYYATYDLRTGFLVYPPGASGWQYLSHASATPSISWVLFGNGYFDDICYA